MTTHRFMLTVLAAAMSAFVVSVGAQAQNFTSAVATTGSDANPCTVALPCASFIRALAVTNPGGQIVVLDSGGYGPATITQPVTIAATGVRALLHRTTASPGFTINTTGTVVIKGISLLGGGIGTEGILVENVGTLYLDNVEVQGFAGDGVNFGASGGHLVVTNSVFRDCSAHGLVLGAGSAYVRGSSFINNKGDGVVVGSATTAVVVDSVATYNQDFGFIVDFGGNLRLVRDEAALNFTGIGADPGGTLTFEYSLVSDNTNLSFSAGGAVTGSNPGTSLIVGTGSGALSTPSTLQ